MMENICCIIKYFPRRSIKLIMERENNDILKIILSNLHPITWNIVEYFKSYTVMLLLMVSLAKPVISVNSFEV